MLIVQVHSSVLAKVHRFHEQLQAVDLAAIDNSLKIMVASPNVCVRLSVNALPSRSNSLDSPIFHYGPRPTTTASIAAWC